MLVAEALLRFVVLVDKSFSVKDRKYMPLCLTGRQPTLIRIRFNDRKAVKCKLRDATVSVQSCLHGRGEAISNQPGIEHDFSYPESLRQLHRHPLQCAKPSLPLFSKSPGLHLYSIPFRGPHKPLVSYRSHNI